MINFLYNPTVSVRINFFKRQGIKSYDLAAVKVDKNLQG